MSATNRVRGIPPPSSERVLLLIDQPVLAKVITLALNHGRFVTHVVQTEEAVSAALAEWQPQLAVIDLDIARGTVLDQLGRTSVGAARIPVVALTRRGDLQTKLTAFDWGVDDILVVPFSPEELLARVLAVLRRSNGIAVPIRTTLTLGELEIDLLNHRVRAGASDLTLTPLEMNLLYLLAANAGQLLTRDEILDALWGVDFMADSNVVDRHIRNLRIKLQNSWRRPRYIATVPGKGYLFVTTADEAGAPTAH
ncbi:MAG: response regulator transcription factor ParR [Chloroflexota bacterium]